MGESKYFKTDPAIEAWIRMRTETYKHYRLTPKNSLACFICIAVIPYAVFKLESQETKLSQWIDQEFKSLPNSVISQ